MKRQNTVTCRGCGRSLVPSPWSLGIGSGLFALMFWLLYTAIVTGLRAVPTHPNEPWSWWMIGEMFAFEEQLAGAILIIASIWIGMLLAAVAAIAVVWPLRPWWTWWWVVNEDARHCWSCGYDVRGNPDGPCGECGTELGYTEVDGVAAHGR